MSPVTSPPLRSLRLRLLTPIIATALMAAVLVAIASYWLGTQRAMKDLEQRFSAIQSTLSDSNFPLNSIVLESLADLTRTQLIGLSASGLVTSSTLQLDETAKTSFREHLQNQRPLPASIIPNDDGIGFRLFAFQTVGSQLRQDRVAAVAVLFEDEQFNANRRQAAILPLATGLSTIVALSSLTFWLTSRLVRRISKLQRRVEAVANGDFDSTVSDDVPDEIGRLGGAVDSMAQQLKQLWNQINRQQSQKLLHQIAGGMAHQLRNSLTGARMAVELHAQECQATDDEGIRVAIHQIELSEDYVRRLLLVASGRQDKDRPTDVTTCFDDVRTSLSPIAKHLRVNMRWDLDDDLGQRRIQDGPTWVAAVTNLIHNAIQAGDEVDVSLQQLGENILRVTVSDNGAGVPEQVAGTLFEPFVTSKPEGMGLGLPVVQRSAEYLGGSVRWRRENERTIFELDTQLLRTRAQPDEPQ
ncbi:Flagellar sensor histidine kinase FleS [Rhodopirellula islandica]|uniref:histidine kinase n=1 Tax=Rhodopirellula islandica TaxID=595434 RepID=A0A0J1BLN5_RHOIS|nr:HAMP domain-containing sensor histidine kinase [Rhodopirellula islandica]KLU07397.1 Flagellar sensor histidine kinase FleS [Rhodopirellula islandica]